MKHSPALKEIAIEKYTEGMFIKSIAEELGIAYGSVQKWISEAGFSKHKGPKSKIGKEDFFDVIDTEEKAYYLGWLMADGNVSIYNGQYSIKIHIAIKDKEIIDNFLEAIESTNKPKDKGNSYYVSLTSRHMVESLMRLGVVPQKTGHEYMPDIPAEMIPHFIRGFFDGDGITDIQNRRSGFVSTYQMCEQIQKELGTTQTIRENGKVYYFLGGIQFSKLLFNYLYSNATTYLNRKRDRMFMISGENAEVTV